MSFSNATVILNNSLDTNGSVLGEFPYWQPTLAITVFAASFSGCLEIAIHVFLLAVLLMNKKAHFQPLNLVHMSLLIVSIFEKVMSLVLDVIYSPSIFRNCICSATVSTVYTGQLTFYTVYRPVTFACLCVLQLLLVSGKKKFVNFKMASGMIALCIGISLIFVALSVTLVYESNERIFCYESYCPDSRSESGFGDIIVLFTAVTVGSFLPSLIIVIVTSTWSCVIFKKYYIGGDDQLNRRMLSLPVVMPLVILASSVIEGVVILIVAEIFLILPLGDFFPYWLFTTQSFIL